MFSVSQPDERSNIGNSPGSKIHVQSYELGTYHERDKLLANVHVEVVVNSNLCLLCAQRSAGGGETDLRPRHAEMEKRARTLKSSRTALALPASPAAARISRVQPSLCEPLQWWWHPRSPAMVVPPPPQASVLQLSVVDGLLACRLRRQ